MMSYPNDGNWEVKTLRGEAPTSQPVSWHAGPGPASWQAGTPTPPQGSWQVGTPTPPQGSWQAPAPTTPPPSWQVRPQPSVGFFPQGAPPPPYATYPGQIQQYDPVEVFMVPQSPAPAARPLPAVPRRVVPGEAPPSMGQDEFLDRLDFVCDGFANLEHVNLFDRNAAGMAYADRLNEAEISLDQLTATAVQCGPIRHLAMCVLARRAALLAELIRVGQDPPGGRPLMMALITSVKKICAADGDDVLVDRPQRFSGRVVLILGYGGNLAKDMEDCMPKYRELDPSCLVIALSMGAEPSGSALVAKALELAVNAWAESVAQHGKPGTAGGAGRPELLVHLFGNYGFRAWALLLKLWEQQVVYPDQRRLQGPVPNMISILRGVVLDSAPIGPSQRKITPLPLVQGDAALLAPMSSYAADGAAQTEVERLTSSQQVMTELLRKDGPLWAYYQSQIDLEPDQMMEVHMREPPAPLLFIFAGNDKIAPPAPIENYIKECERRSTRIHMAPTLAVKLDRSQHCGHRREHEIQYWQSVQEFWQGALAV